MAHAHIRSIAVGTLGVAAAGLALASACSNTSPPAASELVGSSSSALVAFTGLFPTGVSANNVLLAAGSVDPHYTLTASADPVFVGPNAFVVDSTLPPLGLGGPWVANSNVSQWIAIRPTGNAVGAIGSYTYHTTFSLQNIDPSVAIITGSWACDDDCELKLNGTSVATRTNALGSLATFNVPSGAFVVGTNNLDFVVSNTTILATGLRVESIVGGTRCTTDPQCGTGNFCNDISLNPAECEAKRANGQPVPGGTCTNVIGGRACLVGVCDTTDNKCGLANGSPCGDAGGVCRSGFCANNGLCDDPDGGSSDGGSSDGGSSDGGSSDGAASDGATSDASSSGDGGKKDSGSNDGGANTDASDFSEGASVEGGGLGCNASGSSTAWPALATALVALVFLRRKRG